MGIGLALILTALITFIAIITIAKIINILEKKLKNGACKEGLERLQDIINEITKTKLDSAQIHSLDELRGRVKENALVVFDVDENNNVSNVEIINTNRVDDDVNTLLDKNNGLLLVTA